MVRGISPVGSDRSVRDAVSRDMALVVLVIWRPVSPGPSVRSRFSYTPIRTKGEVGSITSRQVTFGPFLAPCNVAAELVDPRPARRWVGQHRRRAPPGPGGKLPQPGVTTETLNVRTPAPCTRMPGSLRPGHPALQPSRRSCSRRNEGYAHARLRRSLGCARGASGGAVVACGAG